MLFSFGRFYFLKLSWLRLPKLTSDSIPSFYNFYFVRIEDDSSGLSVRYVETVRRVNLFSFSPIVLPPLEALQDRCYR